MKPKFVLLVILMSVLHGFAASPSYPPPRPPGTESRAALTAARQANFIAALKRQGLWNDLQLLQVFGTGLQNASNNITLRGPRMTVVGTNWAMGLNKRDSAHTEYIFPNATSNFTVVVAMSGSYDIDGGTERNIFEFRNAAATARARVYKLGSGLLGSQTVGGGNQKFLTLGGIPYSSYPAVTYTMTHGGSGGTNNSFYTNGILITPHGHTNYTHAGVAGLDRVQFGGHPGNYSAWMVWNRVLDTNEVAAVDAELRRTIFTRNTRVILEGDSIIAQQVSSSTVWQRNLYGQGSDWALSGPLFDISTGGHATSNILTEWPAQLRTHTTNMLTDERAIAIIWVGSNDLGNYDVGVTPAIIHGNLRTIWSMARSNGCFVVAGPVLRRGIHVSRPASDLTDLNTLIRADEGVWYDALIDHDRYFAAEYGADYYTNTALFSDNLHPNTAASHATLYRAIQAATPKIFP